MNAVPRRLRSLSSQGIRVPRAIAAATALALCTVSIGAVAGAEPIFPSQQEVDRAKAAVNVAAGSVAEIESAYAAAAGRLDQLRVEAGLAQAAADAARGLLAERTATADSAAAAARQAADDRARADLTLRRTAAQIYQEQGSLADVGAYLEAGGPQDLADRSAVLSVVGDLRQRALQEATSSANVQAEAERTAALAKSQQESAASAAASASAAADARARAAADETARIQAEQQQRVAALAAARQTSVDVERARQEGLARKAAEEEAARKAAEQARIAAEEAARAKAAAKAAADAAAKKAAAEAAAKVAAAAAAKPPATQAPKPAAPAPPPPPPATNVSYPQKGLTPHAQELYNAVRNTFGITNLGGYRPYDTWGDHKDGNAVDVMTRSFAEGDAVAAWAQANAGRYHVKYIIWKQRIWFPGNAADQWRWMADRGSITANHYDHVHISVY